ncbi:hypothetical protein K7C98_42530 [Nannocystis pusilla]|uniref:Uncharacterized protein n=1 Tax=Nannocystis pusilla TaxID=889268 RepID=A0ABS7U5W2_9BACT|nr:hypothetical protein [Nannocystis pusilla]MBZ5715949.1 hypothetical protein [Nannocystis pusilla]
MVVTSGVAHELDRRLAGADERGEHLFLRPTDSPTPFLQQLGRGLRRSYGKEACTVLDFVGRHRAEFRFDRRFQALLGGTRRDLVQQIERGFPFLPAGCHMELDPIAAEIVLIRRSSEGRPSESADNCECSTRP